MAPIQKLKKLVRPAWLAALLGVTLLVVSCRSTSPVAKTTEPYDFSAVTGRVQGWVDRGYYRGAAVLIAKDNQVIYEKCFGDHTPDTQELIASSGKWLAAATIMSLVDEGKLSLDDHPSGFLPEFRNEPKDKATLRQMLSHTSGYPPYQPKENPRTNTRRSPNPWRTSCHCRRIISPANDSITAGWRCKWPDAWPKSRRAKTGKRCFRSASRSRAEWRTHILRPWIKAAATVQCSAAGRAARCAITPIFFR
jgi:hypothetical protein